MSNLEKITETVVKTEYRTPLGVYSDPVTALVQLYRGEIANKRYGVNIGLLPSHIQKEIDAYIAGVVQYPNFTKLILEDVKEL